MIKDVMYGLKIETLFDFGVRAQQQMDERDKN